jgi:MFS family permease
MQAPAPSWSSDTLRAVGFACFMMFLVGLSLALSIPLLSLEMERQGVSGAVNGLNAAVGALAIIVVAPLTPWLGVRLGADHFLRASLAVGALALVAFKAAPFPLWFPLRFVFGAAIGVIFIVSEYWISITAPAGRRGLVMGVYATVLALGFAAGPAVLYLVGTSGWPPYLAGAALLLAGLLVFVVAGTRIPPIPEKGRLGVAGAVAFAPAATLAALIFGAVETGGFALLPVYGVRFGWTAEAAAVLVSMVALGNVLTQAPLGWLADRLDRRRMLFAIAACGALGIAAAPLVAAVPWALSALLFVWGGVVGGLYTVGLAHLSARVPAGELVKANAAFVMLYAVGAAASPGLIGAAMDAVNPHGFAWSIVAIFLAYLVAVPLLRRLRRPAA